MRRLVFVLPALWCAFAPPTSAQGHAQHREAAENPHLQMTPVRAAHAGDVARADSIIAIAGAHLAKYRDVRVAEEDGYRRFAPDVPNQQVYHYTKLSAALKARFTFSPANPSALLYRDDGHGGLQLTGVMYTAPAGTTLDDLDRRVPLSVARWHLHSNICLPPSGRTRDSLATPGARFGFRGAIATRSACEAAGGRFREAMFGWMVHVNLFAPGPEGPWHDEHGGMRHP